jgi:DGQHR domain-containing protein
MENKGMELPVIVTRQGKRLTYFTNMTFGQISQYFTPSTVKPDNQKDILSSIHTLRNRYLKVEKVKEIEEYIHKNFDEFILPPITVVIPDLFPITLVSRDGSNSSKLFRKTADVHEYLDKVGIFNGYILIENKVFHGEILDGNHRAAAIKTIHELLGEDLPGFRIGVHIYQEINQDKIRQSFVDLNTSTPIDRALLTLFSKRDTLSIAAKEVIGMAENKSFVIPELRTDSPRFIGFDYINDAVTRNSQAVLSLNMVKNMILKFALGDNGSIRKFEQTYRLDSLEYALLLKRFSTYMRGVFREVQPFETIIQSGLNSIPNLRKTYISLTGAGLYLIALLGHEGIINGMDLDELAKKVANVRWERMIEEGIPNPLFTSGILNNEGKISNTRNSINSTLSALRREIVG